jgi:protein SCO1/2
VRSERVERTPARGRRSRRRANALPVFVAVVSLIIAAAGLYAVTRASGSAADSEVPEPMAAEATWPAGAQRAPDFTLTNQDSRRVSLSRLRRRTVLLAFLDSRCTNICRVEGPSLGHVQRAAPASDTPLILVVSVNPADTPRSVRAMADAWHWVPGQWEWLMGSTDELAPVWAAYGVDVKLTPAGLLHSGALYVVDAEGFKRAGFAAPVDDTRVTRVVRALSTRPRR